MSLVKPTQVLLAFVVVTCLPVAALGQTTWHVDGAVPTGGDGLTWPTAFNDLQDALAVAVAGDQIWVAGGTYKPSDLPFAVRTATFALVDGVATYGAFPQGGGDGTFAARDVTNPVYETILSGDLGAPGDTADNVYHVVTAISVGVATILDGFTIANGNANGDSAKRFDVGGGMYNSNSSPTVAQCALSDNAATAGGGMYNENSAPSISDCIFVANSTVGGGFGNGGGGMHNANSSSPTVTDCTFSNNFSSLGGGMMNFGSGSNAIVTNCMFIGNTAAGGGGIANQDGSEPIIRNCTLSENSASGGGGMWISHNGISGAGVVVNCTFSANFASSDGGGVETQLNTGTVFLNCIFGGNIATRGAGMYMNFTSPVVSNCTFIGNLATNNGGGLFSRGLTANPTVTNCTFSSNVASDGGAVHSAGGTITLRNLLLWGNIASLGHEITALNGATLTASYSNVQGGLSEIHGEAGAIVNWGAGMIDAAPLFLGGPAGTWTASATYDPASGQTTFVDIAAGLSIDVLVGKFLNPDATQTLQSLIVANTATTITVWGDFASLGVLGAAYQVNDYRLTPASPCVDAGDDFSVPADVADLDGDGNTTERTPLDLDLNPRFADSPPPGGTGVADPPIYPEIVDMGAYEIAPDCNNNGILDPCDLECGVLGGPCDVPGCGLSADCNSNGIPDDCEPQTDCQLNGVLDFCDIATGTSPDCNGNGVPDECELAGNDCNANGIPDDCESQTDCQPNGVQDICDIAVGTSLDCQPNGIPDECELVGNDCNMNGILDDCELDTDNDGVIDDCDNCPLVFNPGQTDIDGDGVGDVCDNCPNIPNPGQADTNGDGIGDVCPCPQRGDMNDDGLVDGNDIQLFVEKLLGG